MSSKRDRSGEYQRKKQRCLQLKICFRCLKPKGDNKWLCDACLENERDRSKKRNAQKRAKGICKCGKPAFTGYKLCETCLERSRKFQEERRNKHREQGTCLTCGKETIPGLFTCEACSGRASKSTIKRYNTNNESGICPFCGKELDNKFRCEECHIKHIGRGKKQWHQKRSLVLEHYGGTCKCCGETTYEFLEIDHINNDGIEHRKKVGRHIIEDIIKRDFPKDLQILCANCNRGKGKFGECPHKKEPPEPKDNKNRKLRLKCIEHYGGKCTCCGEENWAFLEFDHINNDGNEHRKSYKDLVSWIVKNNYPDNIQLLCCNCNKAKGLYGVCPHQKELSDVCSR